MSSFNHIEKIKYTKNPDDVIALQEYIFFEDEREEEKFVVFKFMNNLNQRLRVLKFEVLQYDENHDLLEKSVVVHDDFVAEANASFVPNAKLKANYACKSLGVNLVYAEFDRVKWQSGAFSDNSYKFDQYAKDSGVSAPAPARTVAAASSAPSDSGKEKAGVKNVFRKNIAKFPKVFGVFICLAVIAFVVVSLILFRNDSSKFTIDGFDLELVSEDTVNICGYDGLEKELTIPAKLGDYTVRKITAKAFEHSKIESLTFATGDILVEGNAFIECNSLTQISSSAKCGTLIIMEFAFMNCGSLENVTLPTAQLAEASLNGCTGVKYLKFDCLAGGASFPLVNVFGESASEMQKVTIIANVEN